MKAAASKTAPNCFFAFVSAELPDTSSLLSFLKVVLNLKPHSLKAFYLFNANVGYFWQCLDNLLVFSSASKKRKKTM